MPSLRQCHVFQLSRIYLRIPSHLVLSKEGSINFVKLSLVSYSKSGPSVFLEIMHDCMSVHQSLGKFKVAPSSSSNYQPKTMWRRTIFYEKKLSRKSAGENMIMYRNLLSIQNEIFKKWPQNDLFNGKKPRQRIQAEFRMYLITSFQSLFNGIEPVKAEL